MEEFIQKIAPPAQADMRKNGILASLTIAQGILESAWGRSELALKANNLFGIKGRGPAGFILIQTREWNGWEMVNIEAEFKKYNSWEESIQDHSDFLTRRYSNIVGETDYKKVAELVQKGGYATDPLYADKLVRLIEKYSLVKYDREVLTETQVSSWASEARKEMMALGITDGTRPKDNATREEIWVMMHRFWKLFK